MRRKLGGLQRRTGKRVWYFWYWEYPEGGRRRRVTRSTRLTNKKTAKEHAENELRKMIAEDERSAALAVRGGAAPVPTLQAFAQHFFVWGRCPWIRTRHEQGFRFSEDTAFSRRGHLENHILPRFGDRPLDRISRGEVREWLAGLPVGSQTRNHILNSFRIVLREAADRDLLPANPLEGRGMQFRVIAKRRDVFSVIELQALFPRDEAELLAIWKLPKYATAFLVLASTGIRSGELRALRWADVLWDLRALHIARAAKEGARIGGLKTATPGHPDDRVVLLPARTLDTLRWWSGRTEYGELEDIVFPGESRDRPMNRRTLSEYLEPCIRRAGIDLAGRVLTPHSFRHGYVSMTRREMPRDTLQQLTGHKSVSMLDRYDHPTLEQRVRELEPSRAALDRMWAAEETKP